MLKLLLRRHSFIILLLSVLILLTTIPILVSANPVAIPPESSDEGFASIFSDLPIIFFINLPFNGIFFLYLIFLIPTIWKNDIGDYLLPPRDLLKRYTLSVLVITGTGAIIDSIMMFFVVEGFPILGIIVGLFLIFVVVLSVCRIIMGYRKKLPITIIAFVLVLINVFFWSTINFSSLLSIVKTETITLMIIVPAAYVILAFFFLLYMRHYLNKYEMISIKEDEKDGKTVSG